VSSIVLFILLRILYSGEETTLIKLHQYGMPFVLRKTLMLSLVLYWRETFSATEGRAKIEVFADEEYFDLTDRK